MRTLGSQNKVYSFKRSCVLSPWAIVNGTPTQQANNQITNWQSAGFYNFGHLRFRLDMLPNHTDFINLYERYKIVGVKLKFMPMNGVTIDVDRPTLSSFMPQFVYCINRGAITTTADDRDPTEILEAQDMRIRNASKPFSVYIPYPKFYSPADGITAAQVKGGWIDSKHPEVDHFGLNWGWLNTTTNEYVRTAFQCIATFYIKCANPQ